MKINQQLCQKMEQLDQDEGCKVCLMFITFWQGITDCPKILPICSAFGFIKLLHLSVAFGLIIIIMLFITKSGLRVHSS